MTKCRNDKQSIPTFSPYEIYQYSASMLKHLPEKSLKEIKKTLLYSYKSVYYNQTTTESRTFNSMTTADITDLNIEQRIKDFQDMLKSEHVHRLPLCYFVILGKLNFPLKIGFRTKLNVNMKKLFE